MNYQECHLNAIPLTKTKRQDDLQVEFLEAQEVPIIVMSGNAGSARITTPIVAGDTCLLLYSDREFGNLLSSDGSAAVDTNDRLPFGNYPIGALCGFFTRPNAVEISKENVEIHNGGTSITLKTLW